MQELTERGVVRAVIRLGKQFMSLSPVFEVFSTQIQAQAITSDLTFGGVSRPQCSGAFLQLTQILTGSLHRYWTWFRHQPYLVQHSLLPFLWSVHLHGLAQCPFAALCDNDALVHETDLTFMNGTNN